MSYCKYRRKRKQYLKDGVWYDYSPQVYEKGQLVGCGYAECTDSPDTPPITPPDETKYTRWVTMTDDYYCELGDKYYKMKLQVSNDNINWVDANPPEYKRGNLWEAQSADCGGDNPEEWKFYANICIDGDLYEQEQLYLYGEPTGELRVGKLVEKDSSMCTDWKIVEGEYICEEYKEKTNEFEYSGCNGIYYFLDGKQYYSHSHPVKLNSKPYKSLTFYDTPLIENNHNRCITSLILNEIDTSEINSMYCMFAELKNLVSLDVSTFDTSNVRDMQSMFEGCNSIPSLDLSSFKTGRVSEMAYMFRNCNNLTNIILSSFNTRGVINMAYMFENNFKLKSLYLNHFDTRGVGNFRYMFAGCSSLINLDLSNFDTSGATNFASMFDGCSNLVELNLAKFTAKNIVDNEYQKSNVFRGCDKLNKITCKQAFKDWCIQNQDMIKLPTAMREGGSGTWEIVG